MREGIDKLLWYYEELMPRTTFLKKNKDKYPIIEKAVRELADIATTYDEDSVIKITPDKLVGTTLCLDIETNLLAVEDMDRICKSLKYADTLEICPLTDGNVSVSMTFQDAWVPAEMEDLKPKK